MRVLLSFYVVLGEFCRRRKFSRASQNVWKTVIIYSAPQLSKSAILLVPPPLSFAPGWCCFLLLTAGNNPYRVMEEKQCNELQWKVPPQTSVVLIPSSFYIFLSTYEDQSAYIFLRILSLLIFISQNQLYHHSVTRLNPKYNLQNYIQEKKPAMPINLSKTGRGFPVVLFYLYNRDQLCHCTTLFNTPLLVVYYLVIQFHRILPTSALGKSVCHHPKLLSKIYLC